MERVGIRELRQQLAAQVRRAEHGERLVITVGGRPVAQLGPVGADAGEVTLDDLTARGLVLPARRRDQPDAEFVLPMWAGTRIDQLLREVRGR